uniref:Uncharacterized protein n=1 Tax=Aegilops tauschii TaxID=37682 RepID=M8D406_AEGTA
MTLIFKTSWNLPPLPIYSLELAVYCYVVCLKHQLVYNQTGPNNARYRQSSYKSNQDEARSQNITRADVALSAQERNANAVASSNVPHGRCGSLLQKYASLSKRTTTPPAEHEAANDRIDVTCIIENDRLSTSEGISS